LSKHPDRFPYAFLPRDYLGNPSHCISASTHVAINRSAKQVYDWFTALDISRVLNGYGPLPGVDRTIDQSGTWTTRGETRGLQMSRGITATQEILIAERPDFFAYRVSEFNSVLNLMAHGAEARWWFTEVEPETMILHWTYTFWPRSVAGKLTLYPVIRTIWSWYMQVAIQDMKSIAEREIPSINRDNRSCSREI
jgi:hypothetical protein